MSYEISRYELEKLDAYASIVPGFAFKSEQFTSNLEDISLVKGENVHQGYIDWFGAKRWPLDEYDKLSRYHLVPGDIVLAMDRPWVTAGLKWSYIKLHDPKSLLVQTGGSHPGKRQIGSGLPAPRYLQQLFRKLPSADCYRSKCSAYQ
jgi:hypothetical protein